MLIGIPKEIKNHEYRVSISPSGVREIVHNGHQVLIEKEAGHHIGYDDSQYQDAGALVVETADEIYRRSEIIVKVKEPQIQECQMMQDGQVLFSYLHLAAEPKIANALMSSNCIAIAFETVTAENGTLPLLAPMSEIAGRIAAQAGAATLERSKGGRGVLLSGATGVKRGDVTVIGGGVVGMNAASICAGMGANVTILEKSLDRIRELDLHFGEKVKSIYSTTEALERYVTRSDLVIGAVLVPGAAAPKIISQNLLKKMRRGAVLVDVAIDQGGCAESSKPTTHDDPSFIEEGIVHYCVANMPSAAARTASKALENSILPYVIRLANMGPRSALKEDIHFRNGLNIYRGRVTHEAVANDLNHSYVPATTFLQN